jgi:hypothetical protein
MLVDPPLRYHLPQDRWVRYDRAIDEISEVRQEFVEWIEYGIKLVDPGYSVLDADAIGIDAGPLSLIVDGGGMRSPPPPPEHETLPLYRMIERCVSKARAMALELLHSELIFEGRFRVFARKHEPDADLQMVPGSVWEATGGGRDPRASTARLTTGKAYFDVHFERVASAEPCGGDAGSFDPIEVSSDVNSKVERLLEEMIGRVPAKVTYAQAKTLLGYQASRRKKEIDMIWKRASDSINAMKAKGEVSFPGEYRKPGGNPKYVTVKG